jgi:hypothetical protein
MIDIQKIELELEELKERRVKTVTLVKAIEFSKYDSPKLFRSSTDGEKSSFLNYAPRSNEENQRYLDRLNNELREIDQLILEKRKQLRGLINAINDRLNSWDILDAEKIEDAKTHESIVSPRALKAMQLAFRAEDEAINVHGVNMDKSWQKISSCLKLQPKKETFFRKVSQFLMVDWGLSYGSQVAALSVALLTLGFFGGVGVEDLNTRSSRGAGAQREIKSLSPIVSMNSKNPMDYSFKIVKMSTEAGLTSTIKKNDLGYEIEIIGLMSNSEEQVALKEMLAIPQVQMGDLRIKVFKE